MDIDAIFAQPRIALQPSSSSLPGAGLLCSGGGHIRATDAGLVNQ